jgi:uncharacterized membrane protein YfcA
MDRLHRQLPRLANGSVIVAAPPVPTAGIWMGNFQTRSMGDPIATLPAHLPLWLLCVGLGGLLGSWAGALHLNPRILRLLLAFLLLAAAVKMITASL